MSSGVRWIADRDGVAHAIPTRSTRARCGAPRIDERFAWPALRTCPTCVAEIEKEVATAKA